MENISKAIIAVMTEVNNIGKNTIVWEWKNAYRAVSDKDVKEAIRASMWKNWLCIMSTWIQSKMQIDRWEEVDTWSKETPKPMKTKQSVFTEVETKYLLLHTSWESIELAWYGQWVDTQDKWAGKATTYALKNVLINLFLVPTGEDTDNTDSDDIEVPKKTNTPTDNTDELPWIAQENIDKLTDLIADWKHFTLADIRKKYKVSKVNAEKLKAIWIS